jgi:hypothetical protein
MSKSKGGHKITWRGKMGTNGPEVELTSPEKEEYLL